MLLFIEKLDFKNLSSFSTLFWKLSSSFKNNIEAKLITKKGNNLSCKYPEYFLRPIYCNSLFTKNVSFILLYQ